MRLFRNIGWGLLFGVLTLPVQAAPLTGRVVEVSDGDTVVVLNRGGGRLRIRMLGLDAPEIAHGGAPGQEPWGTRSRLALQRLVGGRIVRIEPGVPAMDKYGRMLALIWSGDRCANLEIVAAGLALAYPRGLSPALQHQFRQAEMTARARGLAMWQRRGGLAELPGDYRARARGGTREPELAR
ncbi:MAG: thermonuclease family protein [Candidatus Sericytochromatia bacterium]|nr:thermonuclease family protein [Candidatus Sericytochromatia bacterium]